LQISRAARLKTIETLDGADRRFLIVGAQITHHCDTEFYRALPGRLPHAMPRSCPPLPVSEAQAATKDVNAMLDEVQRAYPKAITILKPVNYLCESDCPVVKNGTWLYFDGKHLTIAGAEYLGTRARNEFRWLVQPE
jgi:hypothetical protein